LITGLGNPGAKYAHHRHNVGFMAVERLREASGSPAYRQQFQGSFCKIQLGGEDVGLLLPGTFMNQSGRAVQQALHFFKIPRTDLIVVHDELDLAFGVLRIKVGGGTAGHNGLSSIVEQCGGQDFCRVRIGIGRPRSGPVEGHVLSDFSRDESQALPSVLERATAALTDVVVRGAGPAMNVHNRGL
jgi:PTH1 family peptidyl-tRNA hydrolase